MDIIMPGLNEVDALLEMRSIEPGVPALFISGYSEVDIRWAAEGGPTDFLEKPFEIRTLQEKVYGVLAAGKRNPSVARPKAWSTP